MSMIWQSWLNQTMYSMGLSSLELTATLISLVFMSVIMLSVAIATRGNLITSIIGLLIPMFIFVAIGWLSYWVLLIIVLLVAGIYSSRIRDMFSGGSGEE